MKKFALTITICSIALFAHAQNAVLFKAKYLPSRSYKMTMKMYMDIEMTVHGDSATTAKMKSDGVKQPIAMQANTATNVDITTGPLNTKKTFAFTMSAKPTVTAVTMNGKPIATPQSTTSTQVYKGECDADGKLHVTSLTGGAASTQVKEAIIDMLNKLQGEIKFPEKPMAVGESFTMDVPMNVPASGLDLDIMVKRTYMLKAIQEGNAYFDTVMSMTMDVNSEKNGVPLIAKGQGNGSGKAVYNIKNSFLSDSQSQIVMDLNMAVKEQKMDMKMTMRSDAKNMIAALGQTKKK